MKLLIVESPTKTKTISKYLNDPSYTIRASVGHIRDLPKSNTKAVDIEHGFKPHYEIPKGKSHVVSDLKELASKASQILIATDPDREGEAIAWHLKEALCDKKKTCTSKIKRIVFNEITKDAVSEGLKKPRTIDDNMRKAQEARRVLDRIVGYDLSGLIWKKVRYGLSAGRVQSPALRILVEREKEIRAFDPEDFWVISGVFKSGKSRQIQAICKEEPDTQKRTDEILKYAKKCSWSISGVKETPTKRSPRAPFTTSTLQQAANNRLGFSPSRTMRAAQKLYEAGRITYMRTDSTSLADSATKEIHSFIKKEHTEKLLTPRTFKTKSKNAQEAHEAIRPSSVKRLTAGTGADEKRLYELIWIRTVASQMADAQTVRTTITFTSDKEAVPDFRARGTRTTFNGWLTIDPASKKEDVELPVVSEGNTASLVKIDSEYKQTQPPNRYSEAGLVKELEKRGIGRPSTYASIIRTIQERGYVDKIERALKPTDTGEVVSDFLEEHFPKYISDTFTAEMEDELDDIASGSRKYIDVLSTFYKPFHKDVDSKEDIAKATDLGKADPKFKCPECKTSMIIKLGRAGKFLSCKKYPDCTGALTIEGKPVNEMVALGAYPETNEKVYILTGRYGPYVQVGEKTDDNPKPKRAPIPPGTDKESVSLEDALKYLSLPRTLGDHPDTGEPIIANVGRFGPYLGSDGEFRSLKKDDVYKITLKRAIEILREPKPLPKGVTEVLDIGKHPKSGKMISVYKSTKGWFLRRGLSRIYLDDGIDTKKMTMESALDHLKNG